jgi:hypothetical protein
MANEVTYQVSLEFQNGGAVPMVRPSAKRFDLDSDSKYQFRRQIVGTSAEALDLGDVTTPGMIIVHNCDETNFVQFGHDDTGFVAGDVKLPAGHWNMFHMNQAAPYVKADTADVEIEYLLLEAE